MTTKATLCAVPYEITAQDGQVIFEEKSGFPGHSQFTLEWTGCGWYLVDFDTRAEHVFVPHIVAASEWVKENFVIDWNDGVGVVTLK